MDLKYSKEDEEFRAMLRDWIKANLPEACKNLDNGVVTSRMKRMPYYLKLAEKGWLCVSWPKEHGGPGWSLARQSIYYEESGRAGAPMLDMGVTMIGPLLIEYGTEEQRKRYLPKIADSTEYWCQGYSEPNAGSDLANLALRAERDGEDYVLNGQKIWTSGADDAHMIFILVRTNTTDDKKQRGISFLVAPMDLPGIRIQKIDQITDDAHFYETFFEDVRVPVANRIGNENEGWTLAKALLAHERTHGNSAQTFRMYLELLLKLAKDRLGDEAGRITDPTVRQRLAKLAMELDSLTAIDYRSLTQLLHGRSPGPESSIIKLFGSELFQRMTDLAAEIQGPFLQLWEDPNLASEERDWTKTIIMSRSYTIFGGTSEIQRNIISERVLGMPRG